MQIREEDFFRRYRSLSTDELMQIDEGGDLLPEARSALRAVLAERSEVSVQNEVHSDAPQATGEDRALLKSTGVSIAGILWWLYFIGILAATLYGIRIYLSGSCLPLTRYSCSQVLTYFVGATDLRVGRIQVLLLVSFQLLALYGCYGYIRQVPSFSRMFWMLFAGFVFLKAGVFGLLFIAQARSLPYFDLYLLNILIYVPLWVALGLYAFGSKRVWQASLGASREAHPARP